MEAISSMLSANEAYASSFEHGALASPPASHVAVVTCMDARMDVYSLLGLEPGQAHVVRNAGGSAVDALRSLVVSQQLLGTTAVAVVKHTKCGMQGLEDAVVDAKCAALGCPDHGVGSWLGFPSLEEAVIADVEFLRESPLITATVVRGFVYDVVSGHLSEVDGGGYASLKSARPAGTSQPA